jgi:hypothetical protein
VGKTFKDRRNWERKSEREPKDTVSKNRRARHREVEPDVDEEFLDLVNEVDYDYDYDYDYS